MYSSVKGFGNAIYVGEDSLRAARKFLEDKEVRYRDVEVDRHYEEFEGCFIVDLNAFFRIKYDDKSKLDSLVKKLFPKK